MLELTATNTVSAPREAVWDVLSDFGNVHVWNPNLSGSHLLTEQRCGIGASRRCDLVDGKNFIEERISRC